MKAIYRNTNKFKKKKVGSTNKRSRTEYMDEGLVKLNNYTCIDKITNTIIGFKIITFNHI